MGKECLISDTKGLAKGTYPIRLLTKNPAMVSWKSLDISCLGT